MNFEQRILERLYKSGGDNEITISEAFRDKGLFILNFCYLNWSGSQTVIDCQVDGIFEAKIKFNPSEAQIEEVIEYAKTLVKIIKK